MSILILYFLVIFQFYLHHECQLLVFVSQSRHLISLFTIVHTLWASCKLLLGTYAWTATNPQLLYTHTCPVTEFAVASHLNTANSCCHHVFLRHFRFQKCLPVNSNYISSNLIQNTPSLWVRQRFFLYIKSFHFTLHISYNILHIFYNDTVIRFSQIFLNHRILCETHLTNYQNKKIN